MRDFVTSAYTLKTSPSKEFDKTAVLFTKDFGKIEVRVVSGRKPLSKFSMHLEPLRKVTIRLAKRSGFTLTDILTDSICDKAREGAPRWGQAIRSLALISALSPKEVPDPEIWEFLEQMNITGEATPKRVLKYLGYTSSTAICEGCRAPFVAGFDIRAHEFLCIQCASKYPESRIIIV